MKVAVFCFSGAYRAQGFLDYLQGKEQGCLPIDVSDIEGTHCYCDSGAARELQARMGEEDLPPVRWIDSGDYHYMTHLLAKRQKAPFHLLLMDNHPDNQPPAFEGVLSCGSWVKALKEENPWVRDVLTIGPEGCPRDIPEGWLLQRRGERLYVSLDKDILSKAYARTDWTQGTHTLEEVKQILRKAAAEMEVGALDICGELSPAQGATPEDLSINKETNIELYKFIANHLK